jgi:cytosine/uracil/thiamine/allantoin permease
MVVVVIALAGALLSAVVSLLAPLVPVALLGLLVWAIYRVTKRPNPAF